MKKHNKLEKRIDDIFESVEHITPINPPADLADKIKRRIQLEAKETPMAKSTIPLWRYAAAVAVLLLNATAFYQLSQPNQSQVADQSYEQLFVEEFGLSEKSILN